MRGMSADAWLADQNMQAEKVALFRKYVEGDHRADLTPEMRRMLRVRDAGSMNEFNDNLCPIIVSTRVDRLTLQRVEADTDAGSEWAAAVYRANRLDALQVEVHNATIRDGRTFVLIDMDTLEDGTTRPRLTHEPAFDGSYGVIPFYATDADRRMLFAVKLWRLSRKETGDTVRVNVYHDDRIERYITPSTDSMTLVPYDEDGQEATIPWVDAAGKPLGVPLVEFRNHDSISEIENVIPLQDALNRTLVSMVMTAELTAFPIRVLIGDKAPAGLTPGMILSYFAKDANGNAQPPTNELVINWLQSIRLDQWAQGDIVPYIEQARFLKDEIFAVTNTPDEGASSNASGESLKQREIKLLGQLQRFQVKNGNAWEDAFYMAHRLQATFGMQQPPAVAALDAKWKDAQIRNKQEIVALANAVKDYVDRRTYLEIVAEVFDWSDGKIDQIMADKEREREIEVRTSVRGFAEGVFARPQNGMMLEPSIE
jgi:hypothetical protein